MKTSIFKVATLMGMATMVMTMFIVSCNEDDKVTPLAYNITSGDDVIDGVTGNDFTLDKSHSNVNWKTMYYGDNAYLNGKFNQFSIATHFDQANPANTTINAYVVLSSFNTGEPGRDSYGKCGPGYMGVVFDTVTASPLELAPRGSTDTAWFKSTKVVKYGDGYNVTGNLTFQGVTKEVMMPMRYRGTFSYEGSTSTTLRASFEGEFTFKAKTDFGLTSGSIADDVTVYINANYRKNL